MSSALIRDFPDKPFPGIGTERGVIDGGFGGIEKDYGYVGDTGSVI